MKLRISLLVLICSASFQTLFSQNNCFPSLNSTITQTTIGCEEALPSFSPVAVDAVCCGGDAAMYDQIVETGNPLSECAITTAFGPGTDWAIWLPGVNSNSVAWHFDAPGSFAVYNDGFALITGHISNAFDTNQGFDVFMLLNNKRDWAQWSALNRGYKDDLNLAGGEHVNWNYYEMAEGLCYLNGTGALQGSQLILTPKPSNYYFGFQVGTAANNKNANYGISGWFFYNGNINGSSVSGHGDINADLACENIINDCANTTFSKFTSAIACENLSMLTQTIDVVDTSAPVFDSSIPSNITSTCEELNSLQASATDNCSGVEVTFSDNILEEGCNGLIERTYIATDACGNSSTFVQTIDLQSSEPLEFIDFPEDITVECGNWNDNIQPPVSFTEGCGNVVLSFTQDIIPGDCGNTYTVVRTYSITDDCGQVVTSDWTVQVTDTSAPQLFNIPENTILSCGQEPASADVFAIDQCDGLAQVSLTAETIQNECGFTFLRTWTAVDGCGNTTSQTQEIVVVDNTPPVFLTIPQGGSFACAEVPTEVELPAVEDACSAVELSYTDTTLVNGCIQTIVRTFTATDACGNSASINVEYIYGDNIPPFFGEAPGIIDISCGESATFEIETFDNCDQVDVSFIDYPTGDCAGSFIREYTAIDGCQNFSTLTILFSITDTQGPILLSAPEDLFLSCEQGEEAMLIPPVFQDNCSSVELIYSGEEVIEGNCIGNYQVVRTWVAIDACGNTSTFDQNIFYQDGTAPTFVSFPNDFTITCGEAIPMETPIAEDACGSVNLTMEESIFQMSCGSMIIREWTATDDCGNSITNAQTITVIDVEGPVFNVYPEDITISCNDPVPPIANVTGLDVCSGSVQVLVSEVVTAGDCEGSYTITRIFRAFDACDNATIYAQTITVIDDEAPEFINPASYLEITCTNFQQPAINVQDACGTFDLLFEDNQIVPGCGGLIERTYTAIDGCGNTSQFTQTIQLIDNTPPVLLNLPPTQLNIECGSPIPDVFIFAQDNCSGIVPVGLQATTVSDGCTDIFTRTWFAMDDCGNMTEFTQTITATDNTAPVLSSYPSDIVLPCGSAIPPVPQIIATDACDGFVNVEFEQTTNTTITCASVVRTWCATDCSGNETCHTQTISFTDAPGGIESPFFRVVSDAESVLSVRWQAPKAMYVEMDIYTLSGQKIASLHQGEIYGGILYTIPIDPDTFATGIYVVMAKSNAGVFSEKLFIR